ncbi:MAG: copper oxidase [Acetobacteraceae bacterium]|nr:copper oxidase [Acetobacteraceae bacterium]
MDGKKQGANAAPCRHSLALALVLASSAGIGAASAQTTPPPAACARELTADVVALDQAVQFNRYGSHYPAFMVYALRQDVVPKSGSGALTPGNAKLRDDHRPRPLVLRMNVGDCLTIQFQNLLNPTPVEVNEATGVSIDQPATRSAGIHVSGLSYTRGMQDDGAQVGRNASSLVAPGGTATYRLHAPTEGTFLFYNQAVTTGGEANTGSLSFGMFGAVTVQPAGAEWYRSQVSRAELDVATVRAPGGAPALLPTGHPRIDYDAVYPAGHPQAGRPVLAMLQGTKIVHGDLHAIITGPNRGPHTAQMARNPVLEPNRDREQGPGAGTRTRQEPFRELSIFFHDEVKSIQGFPQFDDPVLGHTLHGVGDAFGINYGITGAGNQVLANRLGVGPAAHCAECKYEEFFLTSWAGNDPALVVDVPAASALRPDGTVDPDAPKATKALYPADPANVFPSYLGDRLRMRNLHAGAEQHIFHLHAHQWLANPESTASSYLDSQFVAPGTGRTYEIAFNGSGNRNQTVGDSIFHCHLYPHFAQGMWGLWRVHDTFERGTELDAQGRPAPLSRALPDGEIASGTPIYALVPVPGMALAPLPAPVRIEQGQVVLASNGTDAADNPGYPFFVPGIAGHRPPRPPLDTLHDGGLPRHVATGGEAVAQLDRLDLDKVTERLEVRWLAEAGEPVERAAMAFHALRTRPSVTHDGTPRSFVTNGRPPVRGAPYADPCRPDADDPDYGGTLRTYKGAAIQTRIVMNKAGWHYPQARMSALWEDVAPTLAGARAPEPLVVRVHSGDCVEYHHANLVPHVYELDDYQVRTPTDIIGQHIHLVKFDVTAADGSANGWNYEDGTLSPGEVRERVAAIRRNYGCAEGATGPNCPLAVPHPFFGAGPGNEWLGAMTTVQRWYADPVTDENGVDRGLGSVFTHDHFGPSTHQQNGLYSSVVIEPRGSVWLSAESDTPLGYTRPDGGPTSWAARIVTQRPENSFREFNLQVADFVQAYAKGGGVDALGRPAPDPARVVNGPARERIGLPYLIGRAPRCPGGAPLPCPQAISVADTGTFTVNYRNEPLAHRLHDPNTPRPDGTGNGVQAPGRAGDPAYAFRSDVVRAMADYNRQPDTYPPLTAGVQPGDPWTPLLRAYKRDRIMIHLLAGAHEEGHVAHIHGMRWLSNADDPNSGWRAGQQLGISEHFEIANTIIPPEGDLAATVDHLYAASGGLDGYWNGAWGLMRNHEFRQSNLAPLPNNVPPAQRTVSTGAGTVTAGVTSAIANLAEFNGVCPRTAPVRRYSVSAVAASAAVGANGITWNDRQGNYAGQRGPLVDPTGALFVRDADLSAGKLIAGRPVEPLVLRAAAGECVEVTLTNRLPANWAASVADAANHNFVALPFLVDRFNMNQVRPSAEVGLHAQLVTADPSRSDGANVGLNASVRNGVRTTSQTAASGQQITYRWYAGLLREVPSGAAGQVRLEAAPVEFGAVNLMPADRIRHPGKGLVGALVVLPEGSQWVEDSTTRTQATVVLPGGRTFRDFVLVNHDDVGLRASGRPVCLGGAGEGEAHAGEPVSIATTGCKGLDDSQDAGLYGFNFRTEPMWFRLGHPPGEDFALTRDLDYARALSNALMGGDPRTPIFTARAGQELRFRLLQAGGHTRTGSFTLHGHAFAERPYTAGTVASQRIEGVRSQAGYRKGQWLANREGIGPGNHFDVVVEQAGGPFRISGDYLFRNMFPLAFDGGQWGILRVTP